MKILIYIITGIALALLIYNTTLLDFDHLFEGNSATALIGILAASCVILLMLILLVSKKIEKKQNSKK